MDYQNIVQLNKFPRGKYNVLVPVTTLQVASNLQRIIVSEVQLDTRQDTYNKGPSKDIYYEKSCSAYAITKVAGMKLAAAANISIVSTTPGRTECCQRCVEMARATGNARACGNCPHVYDVAVTVTIRVPEPSGGFRLMQATKEIDCDLEKGSMSEAQFKRFLPHRTAMAESKAFMRAIRAALGLAGTYQLEDLKKPFVVARVVPNLDAPEIKQAVASNYLQSMGMLFEMPASQQAAALPAPDTQAPVTVPEYDDEGPGQYGPEDEQEDYDDYSDPPAWLEDPQPEPEQPQALVCSDCRKIITGGQGNKGQKWKPEDIAGYSQRVYNCILCPECQQKRRGGRR